MKGKQLKRLQHRQAGFTLLELLVVITLIATLATAALVAYDGIGDSAQATAASNSTSTADGAIRNYRAVTQKFPDQWDNLVTTAGASPAFLSDRTAARFANWAVPASASAFGIALNDAMAAVGITEIQERTIATITAGVEPNLQHNEGAVNRVSPGDAAENDWTAVANVAILPTFGTAACQVNTVALGAKLDGSAMAATDGDRQNVINDSLESDQCNLVIALGFGHDAAHSTSNSSVAISTAPTFVSQNINPATTYARYIALFHVGQDGANGGAEDNNIVAGELFTKPRLLAVVDTEGRMIDENIAAQNPN
ncbi:prepilin-type cleavage/methylation domain-containing protein [Methylomonas sp. LW13]|uniref:type II secretion system protein n=1 Tax=unclassified Methylomonas TaxID=2608980 RepID=UPI00051B635C|nr:type II secretion system protein [Methylomonas sp. LW13]QBC27125.1 prepilin-type cleavage/methylation domain-containing protein [Methylomonas sp. LW13]